MSSVQPTPFARDNSLAAAVIDASNIPLLLLDNALIVVAASRSFSNVFRIDAAKIVGRPLSTLGAGEWGGVRLRSLLEATLSGSAAIDAYEMALLPADGPERMLVLNAQIIVHGEASDIRLLLAITDVTDARRHEKLAKERLEEKETLFQELQHRVANSLQIIASVLMQSARRVQSDETRGHLHAAHHRVLSVAAVQSHLAAARSGDVKLATYLTDLCRSISASMIHDPEQLSIAVHADDSVASPDNSMGLGLIVTELVINALKHAFPDHRPGRIDVGYRSTAAGWILSVSDNGVGMPTDIGEILPGLGTSIVDALARKLGGHVVISSCAPGTSVSVCRS